MISIDTETTGVDFWHGARPYFVTSCDEEGNVTSWEWEVDPRTREPIISRGDREAIGNLIFGPAGDSEEELVLQNAKFDVHALQTILSPFSWPWHRTQDTLFAGHVLGSNRRHNLTDMVMDYVSPRLAKHMEELEEATHKTTEECRRYCRSHLKDWRIAKKDDPSMPSAKEKTWKYDMWLPRALAKELGEPADHQWQTVLRAYAEADSQATIMLWKVMKEELVKRDLWDIYLMRKSVAPIAYNMERRGITVSKKKLEELSIAYSEESKKLGDRCVGIAASYGAALELPKAGNNQSLTAFAFGPLGLPAIKTSDKTGVPSLDKNVLEEYEHHYESLLPVGNGKIRPISKQLSFVRALKNKRKRDTALQYMEGYKRFWLPLMTDEDREIADGLGAPYEQGLEDWFCLHPNLNPTGTDTLRWSSNNPNEQNISKQEGFNLRYCFGPAPGREWWSMDAQNIELRIPAFEAPEPDLVYVFEHPKDPPYYGSYHLFVFDILHPELFKKHGKECKTLFESTWYQWVKNGNFAVIYGAQRDKADATYHVPGAFDKIRYRLPRIAALSDKWKAYADKHGYVETIPDKSVNPRRGYPLLCTRTEYGRVMPTIPLNYHVSGTAMQWMHKAMIRSHAQLQEWNRCQVDYYMIMQVHDELVFDFPKEAHPKQDPKNSNLWRARKLQQLMELGGQDIGVPTPTTCEYHEHNWSVGVAL